MNNKLFSHCISCLLVAFLCTMASVCFNPKKAGSSPADRPQASKQVDGKSGDGKSVIGSAAPSQLAQALPAGKNRQNMSKRDGKKLNGDVTPENNLKDKDRPGSKDEESAIDIGKVEPVIGPNDLEPTIKRHIDAANTATEQRPKIIFNQGVESIPLPNAEVDAKLARIIDRLERIDQDIKTQNERGTAAERAKEWAEVFKYLKDENILAIAPPRDANPPAAEPQVEEIQIPEVSSEKEQESKPQIKSRLYRPRFLTGSAFHALIRPLLTPEVGRAASADRSSDENADSSTGEGQNTDNAVVVSDVEEVISKVDALFRKLDVPPEQLVVEAVVVSVQLDDQHPNGIDLLQFNGPNQPFMMTAVEGNGGFSNSSNAQSRRNSEDPLKLTRQFGLKRGILNGDPQALISSLQAANYVKRIDAWQLTVASRQAALLMLADPFGAEGTSDHTPAGAVLKLRPLVAHDGIVHLDIRQEMGLDLLASTGGRAAALTNQFSLHPGQTAVVGGFFAEQPVMETYCPSGVSKIPVIRQIFSKQVEAVERIETIVLLTPHASNTASDAGEPAVLKVSHPGARPILSETKNRMITPVSGTVEHRPPLKKRIQKK